MKIGYVKRVGKKLVNHLNQTFRLRGVGIGGWLLLEGYMVQSYNKIDRPRRFQTHLTKMVGKDYRNKFFEKWYRQFFTEDDIELIKTSGFNSIRIPIDYQFLYISSDKESSLESIPDHFTILDTIIALCKKYDLYVILDMHAAPGGQTGTNIDNSKNDHPDLFENQLYQEQLCYIWKEIAQRYKDEPYIAAYDILNEPLPKWFSEFNHLLIPLYIKVISSIREVDPYHMITLEGLHWSTDWSCFSERLDENLLLQFHKYWSHPDQESIKEYLDIRDKLDVPIFMGEGGENNLEWYYAVFKMYDQFDISFNFWTYKKMNNLNSIISYQKPEQWDEFLESKLSKKESIKVLNELLHNISFQNSLINQLSINHILQKNQMILPAFGYDYFGEDISFHSKQKRESILRKNDNLKFVNQDGEIIQPNFKKYSGEPHSINEYIYLQLESGEWVSYTFYFEKNSTPQISVISSNLSETSINIKPKSYFENFKEIEIKIKAKAKILLKQIIIS